MKLAKLLEYHQQAEAVSALPDNLGDGYLLNNSAIFRCIREETLKAGFSFDNQKNDFYQALPLSQLESIFSEKKI